MSSAGHIPLRICVAILAGHVAFTGNRFILTLHASAQGASSLQIGLILSLLMAGPMLLSVQFGRWSDRMGYTRLTSIGLGLLFAANLLSVVGALLQAGLVPMYVASFFTGTGYMLAYVAVNNAIGKLTPVARTAEAFSLLALSMSVSGLLGPMVSGLAIDHLGFAWSYAAMAGFAAASGALMRWAARRYPLQGEPAAQQQPGHFLELLRDSKLGVVFAVSGVLAMAWDLFVFLAPLHGVRSGLSATATASVVAAFSVGTFAIRLVLGRLAGLASQWRILSVAGAMTAAGFAAFPLMQGVWFLAGAAFLIGMSLGCAQPLSMALVYRTAPPNRVGEAAGLRIAITSFSQSAIPLLFGGLGAAIGLGAAFWVTSAALCGGVVLSEREERAARP